MSSLLKPTKTMQPSSIKKSTPKYITFPQLLEAADIFISILIETATSMQEAIKLTRELLVYKHNIRCMYKNGFHWFDYDRHFIKLQETERLPWNEIRVYLHIQ